MIPPLSATGVGNRDSVKKNNEEKKKNIEKNNIKIYQKYLTQNICLTIAILYMLAKYKTKIHSSFCSILNWNHNFKLIRNVIFVRLKYTSLIRVFTGKNGENIHKTFYTVSKKPGPILYSNL